MFTWLVIVFAVAFALGFLAGWDDRADFERHARLNADIEA